MTVMVGHSDVRLEDYIGEEVIIRGAYRMREVADYEEPVLVWQQCIVDQCHDMFGGVANGTNNGTEVVDVVAIQGAH